MIRAGIVMLCKGKNKTEENIEVICRFLVSGKLRIITVYALEKE